MKGKHWLCVVRIRAVSYLRASAKAVLCCRKEHYIQNGPSDLVESEK